MIKKILVSIIVNCFNGEEYLNESLTSVINQTYKNWELIFWDNQSIDRSAQIFKNFNHPNFNYFYAPHHTDLGEARQLAFKKTKGEWIGFLDCDDIWLPNKLQEQIHVINSYKGNLGLIYSKCELFREELNSANKIIRKKAIKPCNRNLPTLKIAEDLCKGNFIAFPSILYKKDAMIEAGNFSCYKHSPDYFLNLAISLNYDVLAVDKVLCRYRHHQSNLSISINEIGMLESQQIIKRLMPKSSFEKFSRAHKMRWFIKLFFNFKFLKAFKYITKINFLNIILGLVDIFHYVIRYKTKI